LVAPEESIWAAIRGLAGVSLIGERQHQCAQQTPQVVEDQAEIVANAAQQCIDRVTARAGEEVAIKATIGLHMADHRLDGAASPELAAKSSR
jgi:hypothetical protein